MVDDAGFVIRAGEIQALIAHLSGTASDLATSHAALLEGRDRTAAVVIERAVRRIAAAEVILRSIIPDQDGVAGGEQVPTYPASAAEE